MSGYQFIHVETYGAIATKNKKSTLYSIVKEAMREPNYCHHVTDPSPPEVIYGIDPRKIPLIAKDRASQARDSIGRKLRCDSQLMLAGVASVPDELDIDFEVWLDLTVQFLKKKYKKSLVSVIAHVEDERFRHIHFYALPSLTKGNRFHISEIHDGIRARESCPGGYKAKANAYKAAMTSFQDEYYTAVSSFCGLARLGRRVQRISRKEWRSQQKQCEALAQQRQLNHHKSTRNQNEHENLKKREQQLKVEENALLSIKKTGLFNKKYKEKIDYQTQKTKKYQKSCFKLKQEVTAQAQTIAALRREMKLLRSKETSLERKFDVMNYRISLKDQYIQELKLKSKGIYNEKKHLSNESTLNFS